MQIALRRVSKNSIAVCNAVPKIPDQSGGGWVCERDWVSESASTNTRSVRGGRDKCACDRVSEWEGGMSEWRYHICTHVLPERKVLRMLCRRESRAVPFGADSVRNTYLVPMRGSADSRCWVHGTLCIYHRAHNFICLFLCLSQSIVTSLGCQKAGHYTIHKCLTIPYLCHCIGLRCFWTLLLSALYFFTALRSNRCVNLPKATTHTRCMPVYSCISQLVKLALKIREA